MNDNISVDDALKKGHRLITYPTMVIILGSIFLAVVLAIAQLISPFWILASIPVSAIIAWLFWSIIITKWKVWAFENVRNVHGLKKRAIEEKLIWKDDSFFNKTEIWSASDRQMWNSIQTKFELKDDYSLDDDLTVPFETCVYYSKGLKFLEIFLSLAFSALGICLIVFSLYIIGIICTVAGFFLSYRSFKKVLNSKPQIIINEDGLRTSSTEFSTWSEIEDERIEFQGYGEYTHSYLVYKHPGGWEKLEVDELDTTVKQLRKLLRIYRSRNTAKTTR